VHEAFWFRAADLPGFSWDAAEYALQSKAVLPARSGKGQSMDLRLVLAHKSQEFTMTLELRDYLEGSQEGLAKWKQVRDRAADMAWVKSETLKSETSLWVGFTDNNKSSKLEARRLKGGLAEILAHPNLPRCCNPDVATTLAVSEQAWSHGRLVTESGLEFLVKLV
jgi:SH3-like domain-containing protein